MKAETSSPLSHIVAENTEGRNCMTRQRAPPNSWSVEGGIRPALDGGSAGVNEPDRHRVAIEFSIARLDGGDDGEDNVQDPKDGQENEADQDQAKDRGDNVVDEHRDLEVERFFAVRIDLGRVAAPNTPQISQGLTGGLSGCYDGSRETFSSNKLWHARTAKGACRCCSRERESAWQKNPTRSEAHRFPRANRRGARLRQDSCAARVNAWA